MTVIVGSQCRGRHQTKTPENSRHHVRFALILSTVLLAVSWADSVPIKSSRTFDASRNISISFVYLYFSDPDSGCTLRSVENGKESHFAVVLHPVIQILPGANSPRPVTVHFGAQEWAAEGSSPSLLFLPAEYVVLILYTLEADPA